MKAKDLIVQSLRTANRPLAVHEIGFFGASETAISARLREMARNGIVSGQKREGKAYKEWSLK